MVGPESPVEDPLVSREQDEDSEVGWEDAEPDEADEGLTFVGLFDQKVHGSLKELLDNTKEEHDFDLVGVINQLSKFCFLMRL